MYASDHQENLVPNDPNVGPGSKSWILGCMQDNNADSTNATLIARGALFRYNDATAIYLWHNNGCIFSFADGHAELLKWRDPRTLGLKVINSVSTANNPDLRKLQTILATK